MKFIIKFFIALMIIAITALASFFVGKTLMAKFLEEKPVTNSQVENKVATE